MSGTANRSAPGGDKINVRTFHWQRPFAQRARGFAKALDVFQRQAGAEACIAIHNKCIHLYFPVAVEKTAAPGIRRFRRFWKK